MELTGEIIVNVPIESTFAYYADQSQLQEWVPGGGILEFTPLTPPPKRPGSRYLMVYRSMAVTFQLIAELTVLDLNRLSVMEQITGDYKTFHYEMRFTAELPWGKLGSIVDLASRPLAKHNFRKVLERLKTAAETAYRRRSSQQTKAAVM
jgi:hypothetical protein